MLLKLSEESLCILHISNRKTIAIPKFVIPLPLSHAPTAPHTATSDNYLTTEKYDDNIRNSSYIGHYQQQYNNILM